MSEFFTEVDEALKQERLEKLWKNYGGMFLSFLAMIILVTAAHEGYKAWTQHRNARQTALYLNTLDKENVTADDVLALLPNVSDSMKDIVNLRAAGLALEQGDKEKARMIYANIEDLKAQHHDPMFLALANYLTITLDDDSDAKTKITKYDTLSNQEDNPWRYNAMLDAALLEATHNHDYTKARTYLSRITANDSKAPQGLKQKAQSLDILYLAQQTEKR